MLGFETQFVGFETGTGMMPAHAIALLEREVPGFSMDRAELTFGQLGVDSFAMLELRAAIEHATDQTIPDPIWVDLETPASLLRHLSEGLSTTLPVGNGLDPRRRYALNMPQMALGGLSEHWLSKEFGDAHWSMITRGLGEPSSALYDGKGDRLYATITRLRIAATDPLSRFAENECLTLDGRISRLGGGMFFSELALAGAGKTIQASIMSSFTKRGSLTSNSGLLKGQPIIPPGCSIPDLAAMPELGQGYRDRRNITLAPALFETFYDILPYHDINGVGLLYFAAYPTISDLCELQYMGRGNAWAMEASTISRDVFYFANSDVHDRLIYRVHARRDLPGGLEIESSISRGSDGTVMAYLVTHKVVASA